MRYLHIPKDFLNDLGAFAFNMIVIALIAIFVIGVIICVLIKLFEINFRFKIIGYMIAIICVLAGITERIKALMIIGFVTFSIFVFYDLCFKHFDKKYEKEKRERSKEHNYNLENIEPIAKLDDKEEK